jgi:hypothetical protein
MITVSEFYENIKIFFLCGVVVAVGYDFLRLLRGLFSKCYVAEVITDIAFMSAAAVLSFAYYVEFCTGTLKFAYFVPEIAAVALYFLTLGKLTAFAERAVSAVIKTALRKIIHLIYTPLAALARVIRNRSRAIHDKIQAIAIAQSQKSRIKRLQKKQARAIIKQTKSNKPSVKNENYPQAKPRIQAKSTKSAKTTARP